MINEILVDKIIESMCIELKFKYGDTPSKAIIKKRRKAFSKMLEDNTSYLSYEVNANIVKKLIFARKWDDPISEKAIAINFFYFDNDLLNKKNVQREIDSINSFFKAKSRPLSFALSAREVKLKKILNTLDIKAYGACLIGNVHDGLKYVNKAVNNNFRLSLMDYEHDLEQVIKLEKAAHNNEPSSLITYNNKKKAERIKGYIKQMCDSKSVWLVKDKSKVIAIIGVLYNLNHKKAGHIGTISIHPKYQGQGLSKLLYKKAFNDMKKRKKIIYTGVSSTGKILKLSKKLKRKETEYLLKSVI